MKEQEQKQWQGALVSSALLHIVLILIFLFGLPSVFQPPKLEDPIVFEVLTVKDLVNIKNASKTPQEIKELSKTSREVKKSQIKAAPKEQPAKDTKTTKAVTKKQTPKKQPKREQKKKQTSAPKVVPQKNDDVIDSILKNLEKESEGTNAKTSVRNNVAQQKADKYSKSSSYNEANPLSITEELLIKGQIQKHWHELGAPNIEGIHIIFHVIMEKNGIITDVIVKKKICPHGTETACNIVADSALRSVRKASPLEGLAADRYDVWREFDLDFDASLFAE